MSDLSQPNPNVLVDSITTDGTDLETELAKLHTERDGLETAILKAHGALPENWVYSGSQSTLDLLTAEIHTLRHELRQAKTERDDIQSENRTLRNVAVRMEDELEASRQAERTTADQRDMEVSYRIVAELERDRLLILCGKMRDALACVIGADRRE